MRYGADWSLPFCLGCSGENVVRAMSVPLMQNMLFVHVGYFNDQFETRHGTCWSHESSENGVDRVFAQSLLAGGTSEAKDVDCESQSW